MKKPLLAALASSLALTSGAIGAHADESDVSLWLEAGASYELGDHVEIEGVQNLRFDRNVSRISSASPEAGLSVEPWDFLELGAGYRYEYERDLDDEDLETGHRLQADAEIGWDIGSISPSYRMRVQDHVEDDFESPTSKHRLQLQWDRGGHWEPEVSGELYYDLDDREFSKLRTTLGVKLDTGDIDTDLFYRMDLPRDAMDPVVHIMGLGLDTEL